MPVNVKATDPIRVTSSEITSVETKVISATNSISSRKSNEKGFDTDCVEAKFITRIRNAPMVVTRHKAGCLLSCYQPRRSTYLAERIFTYFLTGLESLAPGFRFALVRWAALVFVPPDFFFEYPSDLNSAFSNFE